MNRENLTKRAEDVLEAIINFKINNDGLSPTLRDIMRVTDITSSSVVTYYLNKLEHQGFISRNPKISRGIQVVGGKWIYENPETKDVIRSLQEHGESL